MLPHWHLAAFLVALLPLPFAFFAGRRLLRRVDEPTFAAEYFRHRVRMVQVASFAVGVGAGLDTHHVWMAIAVGIVAAWIGGFPFRKRLFDEQWSLPEALWFRARTFVGAVGFWLLFLSGPLIVARAGASWALPLLALAIAWEIVYQPILLRAYEARPIDDPELRARMDAIVAKANCPAPDVFSIGPRRGFFANAFALPGRRRGRVILTDTLLRNLDIDETAAIFAHEVAHLEEHTPKKTARGEMSLIALMVIAFAVAAFAVRDSMNAAIAWAIFFPAVCVVAFTARRRRRRSHETASDLRAAELCGDTEAVIRALTKIHLLARLPRQWDSSMEHRLTHPSLERRIEALRAGVGRREPADGNAFATPPAARLPLPSRVSMACASASSLPAFCSPD